MPLSKAEMIIHPVRFRILQTLMGTSLTTQQIADLLPDVPKSSIYRHLKVLLDSEMIAIVDTQLVNGIQEKWYGLQQRPYLGPDDVSDMTAADHLRFFTIYMLATLRGFADYLETAVDANGQVDLLADRVGYTEIALFVDPDELNEFQQSLNELLAKFASNEPRNGRHKHKFALITHPVKEST
ncbi:MAG: helix-turn-helix domain-containing protein [Chloroflexota bacterium]